MTIVSLPLTSYFLAILLVIVAAFLGVAARWAVQKFLGWANPFWCDFVMLLVFGIVLLFVKVS